MTVTSDYVSGTISLTNGSASFSGTGTGWLAAGFREGDTIIDVTGATEYMGVIASINANGSGTLTKPWEGPTLTDAAYRMRYQPDGSRVSAQARNLVELLGNGNLQAVAGLEGSANRLPMFTGPGAMTLVSKADLTSGADYDVQVDDLAARAAYDGMDQGFAVLVANTGDGRSAIYSKNSATSGDWSDPAYVTGPVYDLEIGTVAQIPYGEPPKVTLTPSDGGGALNFDLPKGMIIEPGTITTLGPGQEASWDWVPITGGYRVDLSIPQGETGDIDGVTPFWQGRITQDSNQAAALEGLGAVGRDPTDISGGDWNNLPGGAQFVFHGAGAAAANAPLPATQFQGIVIPRGDTALQSQIAWERGIGRTFTRTLLSGNNWSEWEELTGRLAKDGANATDRTKWRLKPIGEIVYVDTSLAGVEVPPVDAGFIELSAGLTGSGGYNEGKLTGETITGSGPTLEATAVIDDAESPMNGETIHLINTEERVRYASERAKSGEVFDDQMQQITGSLVSQARFGNFAGAGVTDGAISISESSVNRAALDTTGSGGIDLLFDSANSPGARAGDRTRAKGQFMVAFLKYKDVA